MIQAARFNKDFRCFSKGDAFLFDARVNIIVGDNGAGKSTLVGLLRAHFDTTVTPSSMQNVGDVLQLLPKPELHTSMSYIDLGSDHMKSLPWMQDEDLDLHVGCLHLSTGQASVRQLSQLMARSTSKIHIIDEPERGLSPAKVMVIGALLAEVIAERPDDQFFIVTHSPEILEALDRDVMVMQGGATMGWREYLAMAREFGAKQAKQYLEARRAEMEIGENPL